MNIYDFDDYKTWIKAWIAGLPKRGRGESRRIAERLRVNSTMVSQVISGDKHFTVEQALELCQYCGLSTAEADYLILLVQRERAGTAQLRAYYDGKVQGARERATQLTHRLPQDRRLDETEKAIFYSSWVYSAIRLATSVDDLQTVDALSKRFGLPRAKITEILEFLVRAGLCESKAHRFRMGPQRTHLEASSPFVARHHANWRLQTLKRLEQVEPDELLFTAPISLSKKDFAKVRAELVRFCENLSATVAESKSEQLAYLNIDWLKMG